jgi:DNA polymerase-1
MIQINTEVLQEYLKTTTPDAQLWVYNSYDVMMPLEILDEVYSRMSENQKKTYEFEKALQAPAFSMMQNGVKVDMLLLARELKRAKGAYVDLESYVRSLAIAAWGDGINVNSPKQMCDLFYLSPNGFQCTKHYKGIGAKRHLTCERTALEKIAETHYYTKPLIKAIHALKDVDKEIQFLERGVEDDGRVHCSYNVAATETGRWSSSKNPWGRGANFQNQGEKTRSIYLADENYVFAYPDLSQAESRAVAYYSGDAGYISAVESGDLHTNVAKLVWPELEWPRGPLGKDKDDGAILAAEKELANTLYYRHFTYRDLAKRGGHALNYLGTPWILAKGLNITQDQAQDFHDRYFAAFPGIRAWHDRIQIELQSSGRLTTALQRERMFFGKLTDESTLKEAVAHLPQSLISDILKIGALYVWREFELRRRWARLCGDLHDGLLMLIKKIHLDEAAPEMIELMTIPIQMPHGVMKIPVDFTVGYRWQKKEMKTWKPGILSELKEYTPINSLLDLPATEV